MESAPYWGGDHFKFGSDSMTLSINLLIIIGSRGLSRFSEMLAASVGHRVLHHAKLPRYPLSSVVAA
jgi:hypothetical protein